MKEKRLSECECLKKYFISKINIEDDLLKYHLNAMMIREKESIIILNKAYLNKAFIVNVLDINYAIDLFICERIMVYDI